MNHNFVEDAGGYFCSVCGNTDDSQPCDTLLSEIDVDWHVIIETLRDSIEQEKKTSQQHCHFNQMTRQRVLEQLLLWRHQSGKRYRVCARRLNHV